MQHTSLPLSLWTPGERFCWPCLLPEAPSHLVRWKKTRCASASQVWSRCVSPEAQTFAFYLLHHHVFSGGGESSRILGIFQHRLLSKDSTFVSAKVINFKNFLKCPELYSIRFVWGLLEFISPSGGDGVFILPLITPSLDSSSSWARQLACAVQSCRQCRLRCIKVGGGPGGGPGGWGECGYRCKVNFSALVSVAAGRTGGQGAVEGGWPERAFRGGAGSGRLPRRRRERGRREHRAPATGGGLSRLALGSLCSSPQCGGCVEGLSAPLLAKLLSALPPSFEVVP